MSRRALVAAGVVGFILLGTVSAQGAFPRAIAQSVESDVGTTAPAHVVNAQFSAHPPSQAGVALPQLPAHSAPPIPVDPSAPVLTGTPTAPQAATPTAESQGVAPSATSSFVVSHSKDLGALADTIAEPSVATDGTAVLETWNSFFTSDPSAAVSPDGGNTFSYLNPRTVFPTAFGGFCCDQVVQYEPSRNLFLWVIQYRKDANGNNAERLVAATGSAGLTSGTFRWWDFTPQQLGDPSGVEYDQPKLAFSNNFLYMEVTRYGLPTVKSVVLRIGLDQLTGTGSVSYNIARPTLFSPGLVQGATTTMYYAAHQSTSQLVIYSWPESIGVSGITATTVNHTAYPAASPYLCPRTGVPSSDWCARPANGGGYAHDARINSGWLAGGLIGFTWDAAQGSGGFGTFPYPYVHVVRVNASTMSLSDEPILWNSQFAFSYMSVAPNSNGDLGASYMWGGGPHFQNCGGAIFDSLSGGNWETTGLTTSNVDPTDQGFSGDYLASRKNGTGWSVTCYALQGDGRRGFAHPYYISFGRGATPPPPTINSFTPGSGPVGTAVTITGSHFTGTSSVRFNGTADPSFVVSSDTQITAHVPTGATTGAIRVTNGGGFADTPFDFVVTVSPPPPTINSFTPGSGPVGTAVTITGSHFTRHELCEVQRDGGPVVRRQFGHPDHGPRSDGRNDWSDQGDERRGVRGHPLRFRRDRVGTRAYDHELHAVLGDRRHQGDRQRHELHRSDHGHIPWRKRHLYGEIGRQDHRERAGRCDDRSHQRNDTRRNGHDSVRFRGKPRSAPNDLKLHARLRAGRQEGNHQRHELHRSDHGHIPWRKRHLYGEIGRQDHRERAGRCNDRSHQRNDTRRNGHDSVRFRGHIDSGSGSHGMWPCDPDDLRTLVQLAGGDPEMQWLANGMCAKSMVGCFNRVLSCRTRSRAPVGGSRVSSRSRAAARLTVCHTSKLQVETWQPRDLGHGDGCGPDVLTLRIV